MTQTAKASQKAKVLYTAKVHTMGGRQHGVARSSDGYLELKLAEPGSGRPGTNPEQLLAAGWSACFESAIGIAALKRRIKLPSDPIIDAEVDLNTGDDGYFLSARLNLSLPGIEKDTGLALLKDAEGLCPYSKALKDSIDVAVNLV
jgi:lipoyl-dependent peroxiredoxin